MRGDLEFTRRGHEGSCQVSFQRTVEQRRRGLAASCIADCWSAQPYIRSGFNDPVPQSCLRRRRQPRERDHSCTTATKCHAYDRSHATPSAQQHSTAVFRYGQARKVAPVGTRPVSTYRQSATRSLRASATTMIRRIRPRCSPTRWANHFASALLGW
jgi:hypothetical protein